MEIKTEMKNYSSHIIIGVSIVLAAFVFGMFYYFAQSVSNDNLSVTGSAKTSVKSDRAKVVINITHTISANDLASGYSEVAKDLSLAKSLLQKSSIDEKDMVISSVSMNQVYDQNSGSDLKYQLIQTVTIQSEDVVKLTEIAKKIPDLASQGAIVSVQSLEYYYSKLPELRVSLLEDAIKDAKARAEKIATGTGRAVGSVRSASSGVVQVLSPNSVDISDYGNYDTTSIDKDIMVTVKASFALK